MANHPGSIEKRGGAYRIRLCIAGERHYFTLKDVTRRQAERFATSKANELDDRAGAGLPGRLSFSSLVARFREEHIPQTAPETQRGYSISLDAAESYFVGVLGDPQADSIRKGHISRYLGWRRGHEPNGAPRSKPLAPRTLAKDRATLSSLFSFADDLELVRGNPARRVKPPKGDQRQPLILGGPQYEQLLDACGPEERPMLWLYVLLLGETGLRCESEALWLRWVDLDVADGMITVESLRKGRRNKSGKTRRVPLTRRLRAALQDHIRTFRLATYGGERTEWVFHHTRTIRNAIAGRRITSLRGAFNAAAGRAGLPPDLVQHDLRHRRATTWLREGKPMHLVSKALGHSTIQVTDSFYSHLVAEDLRVLVAENDDARIANSA